MLIKTKSGVFTQRKKTIEKSAPVTERTSINVDERNPSLGLFDQSRPSHPVTKLVKQKSILSEQSSTLVNESQGISTSKNVLLSKRTSRSGTLRNTGIKLSKENSLATSLKIGNPQKSDLNPDTVKEINLVNFPRFNIQSLNKMNNKTTVFNMAANKDRDVSSPAGTSRQPSLPKSQLTSGNTYYLKTKNKNAVNARGTASRFFHQPNKESSLEANLKRQYSEGVAVTSPEHHTLRNGRSFVLRNPQAKEASLESSQVKEGSMPKRTATKMNVEGMYRDQSPPNKEATYLLNQSNHAFKKARSRQFKNSLLQNVFLNPAR